MAANVIAKLGFGGKSQTRYVPPDKKGEINELRAALQDPAVDKDPARKRELMRKVIGYMTMGLDTGKLFSLMIMATHTKDLVQKKMAYHYIAHYAQSNPELSLLAINTLTNDCRDQSPLVRGLALRSLSSLRLNNIIEYLIPLIKEGLNDPSPYVRRTAVVACTKLYRINAQVVQNEKFVDRLYAMIRDADTQVVVNSITALNEILEDEGGVAVNKKMVYYLVNRIREYDEWQLCTVLDVLLKYTTNDPNETFDIMNLLDDRLKNSNCAVVLGITNVFLQLTQNMPDVHFRVYSRLKDPLLTLMSTACTETAYALLSHIRLMCTREPNVFAPNYKDFYCRYNDASYVKGLKLEVLTLIAMHGNVFEIMDEVSQYVNDVDSETSRKAIYAIGQMAINLGTSSSTEAAITYLLNFLDMNVDYIRASSFVALKDILRKYENQEFCSTFLPSITRHWKSIDDAQSKVAFLWILGEYGDVIDSAPYILETFIDNWSQEHYSVRAQILTTAMWLFFKRPPEMQMMLGRLMGEAVSDFSHADVHDRALLYYRLLRSDIDQAREIIVGRKELINHFCEEESSEYKDRLFEEFNTLSVIYNKPAEQFIVRSAGILGQSDEEDHEEHVHYEDDEDEGAHSQQQLGAAGAGDEANPGVRRGLQSNLLGDHNELTPAYSPNGAVTSGGIDELLSFTPPTLPSGGDVPQPAMVQRLTLKLPELDKQAFQQKWGGLSIAGTMSLPLKRVLPLKEFEVLFATKKIACMASGGADIMKFYFYAQKELTNEYFLVNVVIDANASSLNATIKAENQSLVDDFIGIIKEALQSGGLI